MLTYKEAHELFNYDADTGILTNKIARGSRAKAGEEAGGMHSEGYRQVMVGGKSYFSHRLVILMSTGSFPDEHTDHINGVRDDNRLVNLRAVSVQENNRNASQRIDNRSGVTGVSWDTRVGKWRSRIKVSGKLICLGFYEDWFEAVCARKSADNKMGFHEGHGKVTV
jgi:hypothetical protein